METERAAPGRTATSVDSLPDLVRDALARLSDLGRLNQHPLAVALRLADTAAAPGLHLRQVLIDAIDALRATAPPSEGGTRRRRAHTLMRLRYVDGLPVPEVCAQLAISHSEYYREHARALAAIAVLLQAKLEGAARRPPPVSGARAQQPESTVPPFVGRFAERARLADAFASAGAGRGGRLLLIEGPTGAGKTRLADEAGHEAAGAGGLYLVGRYLRDAGATYGPWIDALTAALADMSRAAARRLAGPYRPYLAQLLPLLRDGGPGADDDLLGPEDRRHQLHDGLVHVFRGLAAQRPTVLLIDDLQWAPGLGPLRHLASRLASMRVLVIATLRQPEFDRRADLARERRDLLRLGGVSTLGLEPLSQSETTHLVRLRIGDAAGDRFSAVIHRRTGGNPLFIEEVLRAYDEAGGPLDGPTPLPPSLRAAVAARVGHLGSGTSHVLAQAAVLGETFSFADLLTLTEQSEDTLSQMLGAAHTDGLIDATWQAGADAYTFRDEHIREALYESVDPPLRRRWHLRAARVLQASVHADDRAGELARHFSEGGDAEAGARYALIAGERLQAVSDWDASALHYRRALELWDRRGGHLVERADACRRLGDVIFFSGADVGQGIGYVRRALEISREAGDRSGEAKAHLRLGREYASSADLRVRNLPQALHHIEAARAALEADPSAPAAGLCGVSIELAGAHSYALDGTAALETATRALSLARAAGDPGLGALAGGLHAALLACTGRPGDGLDGVRTCREAARGAGLTWQADLLTTFRSFLEGILHPARVAALADGLPPGASTPARAVLPQQVLGACAYTGDFARAQALLAMVERTLDAAGQPTFGPEPHHSGRLLLRLGDWEGAEERLTAARNWSAGAGDRSREAFCAQVLGELYLGRGDLPRAEEALGVAVRLQRDGSFVLGLVDALALLARCLCATRRLDDAAAALREAQALIAAPQDWGRLTAAVALAEAVLQSRRVGAHAAEAAFRRALDGFEVEGLQWDAAFTLHSWGCALGGSRGAQLQSKARSLWTSLGADSYAGRLVT